MVRELSRSELTQDSLDFLLTLQRPLKTAPINTTHLFATNYELDINNATTLNSLDGKSTIYAAVEKNVSKQFGAVRSWWNRARISDY